MNITENQSSIVIGQSIILIIKYLMHPELSNRNLTLISIKITIDYMTEQALAYNLTIILISSHDYLHFVNHRQGVRTH